MRKALNLWQLGLIAPMFFLVVSTALAQTGGTFDLSWATIDGGGGQSSGSSYTLTGTIGQPDAGQVSGGGYALLSGFWLGGVSGSSGEGQNVYLPVILRNK